MRADHHRAHRLTPPRRRVRRSARRPPCRAPRAPPSRDSRRHPDRRSRGASRARRGRPLTARDRAPRRLYARRPLQVLRQQGRRGQGAGRPRHGRSARGPGRRAERACRPTNAPSRSASPTSSSPATTRRRGHRDACTSRCRSDRMSREHDALEETVLGVFREGAATGRLQHAQARRRRVHDLRRLGAGPGSRHARATSAARDRRPPARPPAAPAPGVRQRLEERMVGAAVTRAAVAQRQTTEGTMPGHGSPPRSA